MGSFTSISRPASRKDRRCIWCGETIEIGLRHVHIVGVWQNEWQDYRMHAECYAAYDANWLDFQDGFGEYECHRGTAESR